MGGGGGEVLERTAVGIPMRCWAGLEVELGVGVVGGPIGGVDLTLGLLVVGVVE